ncbi:hypothetical protein [Arcanobacterium hippocoleae]|uniref:hypothetical protein n=1 Tax=Arcanobacterium hippocoleae TaxID=149017 RepID=UPI0033411D22
MTGNKSRTISFEVEASECAVMIEQDRACRAAELDIPVDQVKPRSVQQIVDDGWRAEQNSAHGFYRQDGRKNLVATARWMPRSKAESASR